MSHNGTGTRYFSSIYNTEKGGAWSPTYIYDSSVTYTDNAERDKTGAWRAATPADFAANISLSGVTLNIGAVAVTGTTDVNVVNPILPISGVVVVAGGSSSSSTAITGNPFVRISGGFLGITGVPTIAVSGGVNVAVTGGTFVLSGDLGPVAVTGGSLNVSVTGGVFILSGDIGPVAVTGGSLNVTVTGGVISSANPVGITGTKIDLASGYTGVDPNLRFVMVGGRAVNSGFNPGYTSGGNAVLNIDAVAGGLLTVQSDLDFTVDSVTAYSPYSTTVSNSSPSGAHIFTGTSMVTGLAISINTGRNMWFVQNTSSTTPLFVAFNVPAHTGKFNMILNPSSTAGQGGGLFIDDLGKFKGDIYVSGHAFIAWEA